MGMTVVYEIIYVNWNNKFCYVWIPWWRDECLKGNLIDDAMFFCPCSTQICFILNVVSQEICLDFVGFTGLSVKVCKPICFISVKQNSGFNQVMVWIQICFHSVKLNAELALYYPSFVTSQFSPCKKKICFVSVSKHCYSSVFFNLYKWMLVWLCILAPVCFSPFPHYVFVFTR